MSLCNSLLPNYQNLCPKCIQWLRRDTTADNSINNQLIKIRPAESHSGALGNILAGPSGEKIFDLFKWCILVKIIFVSDGWPPKRRGTRDSLPVFTLTFRWA